MIARLILALALGLFKFFQIRAAMNQPHGPPPMSD